MKNKNFKIIFNIVIILVVLLIVLYFSLKDNFDEIIYQISHMDYKYIIIGILILILSRVITGICSFIMVRVNGEKVSLLKAIQFNLIIMFFHGVTPFATGGQPVEVYYLHSEGVDTTKATNVVFENFIAYQTALILLGFFAVIYNAIFGLFDGDSFINKLVFLGFAINFVIWFFGFIISFSNRFDRFVLDKVIKFLGKIKIVKDVSKTREKFSVYVNNFNEYTRMLVHHKKEVALVVFLNMFGMIVLYSIPYVVALGLGAVHLNLIDAIVATTYVMIIGSFVPIPGGTGGLEYGFLNFFKNIIGTSILTSTMLIWRFISYYLGMIIGALALILYRKKERK